MKIHKIYPTFLHSLLTNNSPKDDLLREETSIKKKKKRNYIPRQKQISTTSLSTVPPVF